MDSNEDLKEIMGEVQKMAELKKAFLLYRILTSTPAINDLEKGRILQQLEIIRQKLNMSAPTFQGHLKKLNLNNGEIAKKIAVASAHGSASALNNLNSTRMMHDDRLVSVKMEATSSPASMEKEEFHKRYCVQKNCRSSFFLGKNSKKNHFKRCTRCGAPTLFLLESEG